MKRAYKYRLWATAEVKEKAAVWLSLCRELYNSALQERIDCYKKNIKGRVNPLERAYIKPERGARKDRKNPMPDTVIWGMTVAEQQARLPEIKRDRPELLDVGSQVLKDVLRRLDKTYKAFFGRGFGFPKFKKAREFNSFTFPDKSGWKYDGKETLDIMHVGTFKLYRTAVRHRPIPKAAEIRTVTIKRDNGKWYVVFSLDNVPVVPLPAVSRSVALHLGLNQFITDTEGHVVENPEFMKRAIQRLRVLDRKIARQKLGSRHREETYRLRRALHEHVVDRRTDFQCKTALKYATEYDRIILPGYDITRMVQDNKARKKPKNKKNLKPSSRIADAAWGNYKQRQQNACEKHCRAVELDTAVQFTGRTCNFCGHVFDHAVTGKHYKCPLCGNKEVRQYNTSLNLEDVANGDFPINQETGAAHRERAST